MKKKLIAILLVLALVMVLVPATALADDVPVTADFGVSYTITVPATIEFGALTPSSGVQTVAFAVTATNVLIEPNHHIEVSATGTNGNQTVDPYALCMYKDGTIAELYLAYYLYLTDPDPDDAYEPTTVFASFSGNGVVNGSAVTDPSGIGYAGSYEDTLTFTVNYVAD